MPYLFLTILFAGFMAMPHSTIHENSAKTERERASLLHSSNCLEAYWGKPEELLTSELVGKYVDFEGATPLTEKISEQIIRDKDFAQVNCKWKVDKKRRIVSLKQISQIKLYKSKTATERFHTEYHTRTEAEQAEMENTYKEEVQDKVNNHTADEISGGMDMKFEYVNVDGLGEAAVWDHKSNDLIVLVGNYTFKLTVDLNQGNEYDLEKAKQIAEAILAKACS